MNNAQEMWLKLQREFWETRTTERLGQFIINRWPTPIHDPDIYHDRDHVRAATNFGNKYVFDY